MAIETLLTPDLLRKLLKYEPETGKLFWLPRPIEMFADVRSHSVWSAKCAGKEAFTSVDPDGYLQGTVLRKKTRAHRLVWALHYGKWPAHQIDHLNGDRADNRIANLRDVPNVINARNMLVRNGSRYSGVKPSANGLRWISTITIDYRSVYLGTFDTFEEAMAVRRTAELKAGFRPTSSTQTSLP